MIMNLGVGEEWVVVWGENEFGGGGFSPLSGSLALLVDQCVHLELLVNLPNLNPKLY